jgi:hypothetical protein
MSFTTCVFHQIFLGYQIKEDGMGRSCSTHGRDKKCIIDFGQKTWREETTQKIIEWILGK